MKKFRVKGTQRETINVDIDASEVEEIFLSILKESAGIGYSQYVDATEKRVYNIIANYHGSSDREFVRDATELDLAYQKIREAYFEKKKELVQGYLEASE